MEYPGPLLQVRDVSRRFASPGGGAAMVVLDRVSLEVRRGDSVAIVGPSGSGKSTLLHLMGSLDRPDAGEVLLEGQNLSQMDERQLAAVRSREFGFVFQAHYLLPQCTVLENVLVPTLVPGIQKAEITGESSSARAARLLARVGLADRAVHRPGQLSGGERQRVAVVRALINRPKLLLADEPTGALDAASAEKLGQLLRELNGEEGTALVVVTHSMELARRMGRVLRLREGKLEPGEKAGGSGEQNSAARS